jgi:hypothetical protein
VVGLGVDLQVRIQIMMRYPGMLWGGEADAMTKVISEAMEAATKQEGFKEKMDALVVEEMTKALPRVAANAISEHSYDLQRPIKDAAHAWLKNNPAKIEAAVEAAAEKLLTDGNFIRGLIHNTISNELNVLAEKAVKKALAKQETAKKKTR